MSMELMHEIQLQTNQINELLNYYENLMNKISLTFIQWDNKLYELENNTIK